MRGTTVSLLLCALMATLAGPLTVRGAEPPRPVAPDVLQRFRAGVEAYREGLHRLAAVAFDEANARAGGSHPALVFDAALAYDRAGDKAVARARYARFVTLPLAEPRSSITARKRLAALSPNVIEMLPHEQLLPLLRQLRERLRKLSRDEDDKHPVKTVSYLRPAGELERSEPDSDTGPPLSTFGWVGVGVGAVVLVAGVVLKVDALSVVSDLETIDRRPDGIIASPTQKQAFLLASEASRQDNSATIALSVGGGLVAVGVTLLLVDAFVLADDEDAFAVTPSVAPLPQGAAVGLGGRF